MRDARRWTAPRPRRAVGRLRALLRSGAAPPPGGRAGRSFRELVHAILMYVPRGKVVTYGQLALLAGRPRGARQVGWIAHAGGRDLPWQRVVNRVGGLASGYRGGRQGQRLDLEADGVRVRDDLTVDLARYQWWPDERTRRRLGLGIVSAARRRRPRPRQDFA